MGIRGGFTLILDFRAKIVAFLGQEVPGLDVLGLEELGLEVRERQILSNFEYDGLGVGFWVAVVEERDFKDFRVENERF